MLFERLTNVVTDTVDIKKSRQFYINTIDVKQLKETLDKCMMFYAKNLKTKTVLMFTQNKVFEITEKDFNYLISDDKIYDFCLTNIYKKLGQSALGDLVFGTYLGKWDWRYKHDANANSVVNIPNNVLGSIFCKELVSNGANSWYCDGDVEQFSALSTIYSKIDGPLSKANFMDTYFRTDKVAANSVTITNQGYSSYRNANSISEQDKYLEDVPIYVNEECFSNRVYGVLINMECIKIKKTKSTFIIHNGSVDLSEYYYCYCRYAELFTNQHILETLTANRLAASNPNILLDFKDFFDKYQKIMPKEYKKMLKLIEAFKQPTELFIFSTYVGNKSSITVGDFYTNELDKFEFNTVDNVNEGIAKLVDNVKNKLDKFKCFEYTPYSKTFINVEALGTDTTGWSMLFIEHGVKLKHGKRICTMYTRNKDDKKQIVELFRPFFGDDYTEANLVKVMLDYNDL